MTTRPSTAQLDLHLQALVAELSVRDMGCAEVSLFLGCSPSSARNYINRLLDAGIVAPRRIGGACGRARILYRSRSAPEAPPALRDPLVTAFFGSRN
jgi:predicted transcriptional regulator